MGMIRLLLAFAVVFGHAAAFGIIPPYTAQAGYFPIDATLAVELFFVLSGFCMGLCSTIAPVRCAAGSASSILIVTCA
jgi:peptidoglycan/LPS O-acetylase OafA/YrhL